MDQPDIAPAQPRSRRLARWGALAGGLAVAGGLTAGGAAAFAAGQPAAPATAPVADAAPVALPAAVAAPVAAVAAPAPVDPAPAAPVSDEIRGDFSAMPEGYGAEQYDTFWSAGYTYGDVLALAALWSTDEISAKARAGQALLDGQPVPVAPGSSPEAPGGDADPLWTAFSDAGYTVDDAVALAELWDTDVTAAKARIGQAVLDGEELPIAPGSAPAAG